MKYLVRKLDNIFFKKLVLLVLVIKLLIKFIIKLGCLVIFFVIYVDKIGIIMFIEVLLIFFNIVVVVLYWLFFGLNE